MRWAQTIILMNIYHNSQNAFYRHPFGAAPVNSDINLRLIVSDTDEPADVFLQTFFNGSSEEIPMEAGHCDNAREVYSSVITLPEDPGLLFYSFKIVYKEEISYYGNNPGRLGGEGSEYENDPIPFQITAYRPDTVPAWYREGIVYQIFPDRFARSESWMELQERAKKSYYDWYATDAERPERAISKNWEDTPIYPRNHIGGVSKWLFSGGNLDGIRSKLDYLAGLGVTILYLNPVFKAASNHKYDTADYLQIDESFGDEESFHALCEEAKERGIRIILDGVFSHTGADSKYFNLFSRTCWLGACQGPVSPYYSWYTFTDDGYDSWWGVKDLPNVNELNDSYMDMIFKGKDSVIRHWMRLGASGWRLDVADELPDEFIQGIREAMKEEDPDSLLLGEVWEDASNKTSYGMLRKYFWGSELQSVMNYPFRTASIELMKGNISTGTFCALLMSLKENYPRENFYANLNLIGSHDRARILNELSDMRGALEERIEYVCSNHTYSRMNRNERHFLRKGTSPADAVKAAFTIPEDKIDLARRRLKALTMLQFVMPGVPCIYYGDETGMTGWEDPYNRGTFPWGSEDADLSEHYRMLTGLRKEYPVLISGDFIPSACSDHVVCFHRFDDEHNFRLYVNRGIFEWEQVIPPEETGSDAFTLPPLGWKIIYS